MAPGPRGEDPVPRYPAAWSQGRDFGGGSVQGLGASEAAEASRGRTAGDEDEAFSSFVLYYITLCYVILYYIILYYIKPFLSRGLGGSGFRVSKKSP